MRPTLLALVRALVGLAFLATGAGKFLHHAAEARSFAHWGLPMADRTVYVIGVLELVGGLVVLLGLVTRLGALLLLLDMLGALATAGRIDHGFHIGAPLVLGTLCLVLVARGGGRWQLLDTVDPA
jgi:putative oxidoreductase